MNNTHLPELLYWSNDKQRDRINALLNDDAVDVFDTIESQLRELLKTTQPSSSLSDDSYKQQIAAHIKGYDIKTYGVWVYYPWSKRIIHILPEEEFIAVRTNRNALKITKEEQQVLRTKKVGVIGLSVGQSIALTMAMERICGTIRLADFDQVELSNLNRIRTGLHNLGLSKSVIAAREIAEIDPFLNVEIYTQGINQDNIRRFLSDDGNLDLLVEVCDSLDIKFKSRIAARNYQIPVVMETNDRCLLDIERFDIEGQRPILHGLVSDSDIEDIEKLSPEERLSVVWKIVNGDQLSARMKDSFAEIGKSLRAWPQLASSVTLGAGVTTDIARKILLKENILSGRHYFDIDRILDYSK